MSKGSERVRKARRKKAAVIRAAKSDKPCADCGLSYPYYVMQFDHARGEKEFSLCYASRFNASYERIAAELMKCDIVCSNCHAERTFRRGGHPIG